MLPLCLHAGLLMLPGQCVSAALHAGLFSMLSEQ
jgi:hypothetical protein